MSQAVVYRVWNATGGDQWFAHEAEANAASSRILAEGKAVSISPVPLPRTAEEFARFMREFRPWATGGLTAEAPARVNAEAAMECGSRPSPYSPQPKSPEERRAWVKAQWDRTANWPNSPMRKLVVESAGRWGVELP